MIHLSDLHDRFKKSTGVSIDTRTLKKGNLFFALKGEKSDGHQFINQAISKGCSYVVAEVGKIKKSSNKILYVQNVLQSLQNLANYHRTYGSDATIVAITGSNGKTTTKELIKSILETTYDIIATEGNYNNHIGVPLTLLKLTKETKFGIIEMGASAVGEIALLCQIAEPDYGYITNFGKAHLEGFQSLEGVIKGKTELYQYLIKNQKCILINQDDPIQKKYIDNYKLVYSFGIQKESFELVYCLDDQTKTVTVTYRSLVFKTHLHGAYNFPNVAAAINLGLIFNVPLQNIGIALDRYEPQNNRSQKIKIQGVAIFLDAYNANPDSMQASLESFLSMNQTKAGVVLGDMLELGDFQQKEHQIILDRCVDSDLNFIYLVGKIFPNCKFSDPRIKTFESAQNVVDSLWNIMNQQKIKYLLLKGSRKIALEQIAHELKKINGS
ncbi:MAG: UDP-N-acetylmuramoyl-tripeptide--D-alanyl-D-alanine ligase [Flavobacteriaceae bacterium]|nr:UDP-N-acetylmuramoyl-tripeptide--D-alanyl-D-alanine ligase [Flavobacteriaceae bacterium]MCY4268008.1 UDP-N-acetylmuramoyl-tripeptide--D-alanyl-D-alanine ligase [Flavobacteriaceae bacterium]